MINYYLKSTFKAYYMPDLINAIVLKENSILSNPFHPHRGAYY